MVLLKLAKVCLRCIHTHKHKHCLANGHTNENDPVWDSDHLKHLLPPFFCQKNSNSTSALVISRPKSLKRESFPTICLTPSIFRLVSWRQHRSTLLDTVSTTSLAFCFIVPTLSVRTRKDFGHLMDSPLGPDPAAPHPRAAKPETLPTTLWLPAQPKRFLWFRLVMSICSMVLWPRCPSFQPTRTLYGSPRAPPFPTNLGCVLHRWQHELVALFRWTTAKAPGSLSVDSCCRSYCHPGCDRLVSGIAATF